MFRGSLDFIQMYGKLMRFCFMCIKKAEKAVAQEIHQGNFRVSSKIRENRKNFHFCHLRYVK